MESNAEDKTGDDDGDDEGDGDGSEAETITQTAWMLR